MPNGEKSNISNENERIQNAWDSLAEEMEDQAALEYHFQKMEQMSDEERMAHNETNINRKTGKERTYSEWDLYPQMKGGSSREFGDRAINRHKSEAEFQDTPTVEDYNNARRVLAGVGETTPDEPTPGEPTAEDYTRARRILNNVGNSDEPTQADYDRARRILNGIDNQDDLRAHLEAKERAGLEDQERNRQKLEELEKLELRQQEIQAEKDIIDRERENIKKHENLAKLEKELDDLLPNLAELYARNRRLFVGAKNRANFIKAKEEYSEKLNEFLKLKAQIAKEDGDRANMHELGKLFKEKGIEINGQIDEFTNEDPNTPKTEEEIAAKRAELVEEAEKELRTKYGELTNKLKTEINADFLQDLIAQQTKLETATIDKLDNGTLCRKVVSKILDNKVLKGVLIAAGVAGLAATGIGLATGAVAVGLSYTAGGIALGAGKGALSGALMSRQSSKNSAVRGFVNEEDIKKQIEGIDVTKQNADIANVAGYLIGQYDKANRKDAGSNKKKTAISAGLGAAFGAAMSGVQVNSATQSQEVVQHARGHQPDYYETAIDKVNIPEGGGAYDTFTQLGGDPNKLQEAVDIMWQIDPKYSMVPGSNGAIEGFSGQVGALAHTYPGSIESWPDVAQSYITEVIQEWARRGLIPATKIAGQPLYNAGARAVASYIPNAFANFLARAMEAVGGGAIGGAATIRGRRAPESPIPPRSEARA